MTSWLRHNRGYLAFLLLFGLFRTAVADWNPIPSGSMRPTLLEGDVVFVNRLAYDLKLPLTDRILVPHLGEPQRGDVVTFHSPADGTRLIKRLVALPGDVVEMRRKQLWINGQPARYDEARRVFEHLDDGSVLAAVRLREAFPSPRASTASRTVQWMPALSRAQDFGPLTVPPGHYLMLGDNRDNSADSRDFGFVPRERLIGRAERVLASLAYKEDGLPRLERFGQRLR